MARRVYGVPAFHDVGRLQAVHEKLEANGTINAERLLNALVIVAQRQWQTCNANLAVEKVFPKAHPAYSASVAMKLAFRGVIIVESAGFAKVFAECHPALGA
jgi:2C-methyl-D-erythritol 2,4-cyclodiphosphate synthase